MPSLKKDRIETVETLSNDFDGIEGLVVAGYVGVKTPELNELRGKLRPLKAKCQIVKNRLAKIALKNRGFDDAFGKLFTGQSALVIQRGDAVASLKVLVDFEKAHQNYKIRGGVMNGRVMQAAEIKAVAALPPRKILLALLLGRLQGPLTQFAGALSADLRNLAGLLDQIAKKKQST